MKIVSRRGKPQTKPQTEEKQRSLIITNDVLLGASPEDIKAAEEIFKEIRRQLEEIGKILT